MSARPRIARAITLLVILWPLAHYPLVRAFQLSPWSFGGFAMYTTPRPTLDRKAFTACKTVQYLCSRPSPQTAPHCEPSSRQLHAGDILE